MALSKLAFLQSDRSGYESFFRSLLSLPFLELPFTRLKWRDKGERFASPESISSPALRFTLAGT
nr:hypothetical protein [Paenibacillus xylanexedens]